MAPILSATDIYETLSLDFGRNGTGLATMLGFGPDTAHLRTDDVAPTARGGFRYKFTPDVMGYFTYSHGYKGKAFDESTAIVRTTPVQPETVDAYELGVKSELFGRRLVANADLFREDFSNFQAEGFDAASSQFVLDNVGVTRSQGVELDFEARLVSHFSLTGAALYDDAEILSYKSAGCYSAQTAAEGCALNAKGAGTQDLSLTALPNAPRYRGNLSARYEDDIPGLPLTGFVEIDGNYQSSVIFALSHNPFSKQDGYGLLNASIGVSDESDHYHLTLFARNLTDRRFASFIFDDPIATNEPLGGVDHYIPREAHQAFGFNVRVTF